MPEGTIMRCIGRFDNSADNANNPDPGRVVGFGEQTDDEMLIGYMDAALDYQDLSDGSPRVVGRADGRFDVTFRHRPPAGVKTVHLAAGFNRDYSPAQKRDGPGRPTLGRPETAFTARLRPSRSSRAWKAARSAGSSLAGSKYRIGRPLSFIVRLSVMDGKAPYRTRPRGPAGGSAPPSPCPIRPGMEITP
jgi:hypothetical protein